MKDGAKSFGEAMAKGLPVILPKFPFGPPVVFLSEKNPDYKGAIELLVQRKMIEVQFTKVK